MKSERKLKLLKKTSKHYLMFGLASIIIGLVALFFITQYVLKDEVQDALHSIALRVTEKIEKTGELTSVPPIIYSDEVERLYDEAIKDTIMLDPVDDELETFRELTQYKTINNKNYKIVIRTRAIDSEDILLAILGAYAGIFMSFLLAQFVLNKKNNSLVWKPFFDNLKIIKSFSLQSNEPIELAESDIEEFSELNSEIQTLTNKVITDYNNLKQFTEDISHEIQTPLAIIQAKIGNLFDENEINENQYNTLIEIQNNCRRLTVLNKKLILLTKIENQQFKTSKEINFTEIVKKTVADFKELSQLPFTSNLSVPLLIFLDEHLARVIADNLVSNAIKYTKEGGGIFIETQTNKLIVSNTGQNAIKEPDKLFNRFFRETHTTKSLGLGLAIVKKICDTHDYSIQYAFKNARHTFTIDFHSTHLIT